MEYGIKITGSGTPQQLADALRTVADSIESSTPYMLDGAEWEDPILMTEINEYDDDED